MEGGGGRWENRRSGMLRDTRGGWLSFGGSVWAVWEELHE